MHPIFSPFVRGFRGAAASGMLAALALVGAASAQTTAFTYQGRLTDGGSPANGSYEVRFTLHSAATGATQVGTPVVVSPLEVTDGLFTAALDFGAAFSGADRWLELAVRPAGSTAAHVTLAPRQRVTSAPYAVRAQSAQTAASVTGNVSATQVVGGTLNPSVLADGSLAAGKLAADSVGAAQLATGAVGSAELGNGVVTAGKFSSDVGVWGRTGSWIHYTGGFVGIGTAAPASLLDVVGGDVRIADRTLFLRAGGDGNHGLGWFGTGRLWGTRNVDGPVLFGFSGGALGNSGGGTALAWDRNGRVDVGTPQRAGVLATTTGSNKTLSFVNDDFVPGIHATSSLANDTYAGYMRLRHVLELWPKPDNSAAAKLDVRDATGAPTIALDGATGDVTARSITITGGSDLAEPFDTAGAAFEAGSVLVIDPAAPGRLRLSGGAYDRTVAGVVSGAGGINPGISLQQEGVNDSGQKVALAGRVFVLADATASPIEPGDLLTTSAVPGHAMAVRDHARSQGAVLGKAMSGLPGGKGLVLVLVSLQ